MSAPRRRASRCGAVMPGQHELGDVGVDLDGARLARRRHPVVAVGDVVLVPDLHEVDRREHREPVGRAGDALPSRPPVLAAQARERAGSPRCSARDGASCPTIASIGTALEPDRAPRRAGRLRMAARRATAGRVGCRRAAAVRRRPRSASRRRPAKVPMTRRTASRRAASWRRRERTDCRGAYEWVAVGCAPYYDAFPEQGPFVPVLSLPCKERDTPWRPSRSTTCTSGTAMTSSP